MTAGSPNGTGLFFPDGLSGFTNATESNLLGRRRLLAAPQEEIYPVAAATSSRKLQQTNSTSGVRSPPLTQQSQQGAAVRCPCLFVSSCDCRRCVLRAMTRQSGRRPLVLFLLLTLVLTFCVVLLSNHASITTVFLRQ